MSTWLLDGPTKIKNLKGIVAPNSHPFYRWCPGRGLLYRTGNAFYGELIGVVTLDGWYEGPLSQIFPRGWWPEKQKMLATGYWGEATYEPRVFVSGATDADWELPTGIPDYVGTYLRLRDRRLYYFNGIQGVSMDGLGTTTREGPDAMPFYMPQIHEGRNRTEAFIGGPVGDHGVGVFYDTVTKELSSPYYHFGAECQFVAYAPEFGVVVTGTEGETPEIRVWALEVEATTVGAPEVVAGEVRLGQIVTFQTKITGAHDDPVDGELVNWSLTGAGVLMEHQSKTDKNGLALTRVRYYVNPIDPANITELVASITV